MAKRKPKIVTVDTSSSYYRVEIGEKFRLLKSYWYNGEGWYRVVTLDGGLEMSVPSVFFS